MKVVVLDTVPTSPNDVDDGSATIAKKTIKAGASDTVNVVIAFKWDFGSPANNPDDTPFGTNAAAGTKETLALGTLKITADQVD